MHEGGRTLSTADKKVDRQHFQVLQWQAQSHRGYEFRRVTTEKRKDFDEDGKRTVPDNLSFTKTQKKESGIRNTREVSVKYILIIKIIK